MPHDTYHTSVFQLKRRPNDAVRTLLGYMEMALCLPISSATVELGPRHVLKHSLGGRDALILASYLLSKEVKTFVTMDKSLLSLKKLKLGKKLLKITLIPP